MKPASETTVLIVDDDQPLRNAIAFDFQRRGFKILMASNGTEAFEMVRNNSVDVVVSDIRMPGGNGVELLENIKAHNFELPVLLFISGFSDLSLEQAYDLGADAVFTKPFNRKHLMEAVIQVTIPRHEKWIRQSERIETEMAINVHLPDLNKAVKAKILNIGRGGMFVAMDQGMPTAGSTISFSLHLQYLSQGGLIEGTGIVRWVRVNAEEGKPSGCGVEFVELDSNGKHQIIDFINRVKTKSFIPVS